jgi:ATP-dependent Clp protease ATP-binding subunit ClpX
MRPTDINEFLRHDVLGQEEALRFVSVAIFKHLQGEPYGNLLMLGNSGTGKTTIMRAMEHLYNSREDFKEFRVVVIMNANTLASDEGTVDTSRVFARLEERARQILGMGAPAAEIGRYMQHATVCIDEIDKVSGVIGGKPYVTGINIQQALLTLIEGEKVLHEMTVTEKGTPKRAGVTIDTGKMLFLGAGAFETLYDQVFRRVTFPPRRFTRTARSRSARSSTCATTSNRRTCSTTACCRSSCRASTTPSFWRICTRGSWPASSWSPATASSRRRRTSS